MSNGIEIEEVKIGRTPEVDESRIIDAGKRLENAGKSVTKWGLRNAVGAGNPSRLMRLWEAYKAENGEVIVVAANAEEAPTLPPEVEDGLRVMLGEVNSGIEQLIRNSNAIAVRVADMRVKTQYDAAKAAQVNAENELSEAEAALDQADQRITDLAAETKQQSTLIRELTGQHEKIKAEHEQLLRQYKDTVNKTEQLQDKVVTLADVNSGQKTALDIAQNENKNLKAEIERLRAVEEKLNATNQELATKGAELKSALLQNEKQEQQLDEFKLRESELKELLHKTRLEAETYKAQMELRVTQFEEQRERAVKAEQENASLHAVIAKQAEELGAANANLATLSNHMAETN